MSSEAAVSGFLHPEWVAGRRLWIDPAMQAVIDKIRFGDSVRGWEGDEDLAVFWNEHGQHFELMRYEKGDYSLVARSKPGVPFDERIIDELVKRDMRRNPKRDLAREVEEHNEGIREQHRRHFDELMKEEVRPRLKRALWKNESWI